MTLVRHAHVSGRYDAKPQHVADYAATVVGDHADVLTMTEVYDRRMYRVIRRTLGSSWRCTRRGEYVVAVRREHFRIVAGRGQCRRLSHAFTGRDKWRDLYVYGRTIVHRETSRHVFVTVGHLASGVESGDGYRTDASSAPNVRANSEGSRNWGNWLRAARARKSSRVRVAAMDCNLNQRSEWHRGRLTGALGMRSMWAKAVPPQGTHGDRLIDTIHTDAPIERGWISPVKKPADMDHRAVVAVYRIEAA